MRFIIQHILKGCHITVHYSLHCAQFWSVRELEVTHRHTSSSKDFSACNSLD